MSRKPAGLELATLKQPDPELRRVVPGFRFAAPGLRCLGHTGISSGVNLTRVARVEQRGTRDPADREELREIQTLLTFPFSSRAKINAVWLAEFPQGAADS